MSDEELIEFIRTDEETEEDDKLVHEALARINIAFKKKGIDCGGFIWFGDSSFGMTNADYYKHLGKMYDACERFSRNVINAEDEDE